MDVLLKLRVLIWALVICLWGLMVYQYLGEEERDAAQMQRVINPYEGAATPSQPPLPPLETPPDAPPAAPADPALNILPLPEAVGPAPSGDSPSVLISPPPMKTPAAARPPRRHPRIEYRTPTLPDPPIPPGFVKTGTKHFNVYSEQSAAAERFLELLETLHANLMLDLAPFSPWARAEKISVFLFKDQETYRKVTGRPAWSGGASSVPKRKVYVYESEELPGILAHEMTHIYFDGFFLEGTTNPLWLSEGMATLVQVERGLAAPNWLRENLVRLEAGESFAIENLIDVSSTSGWPDERVRLWYAQSYSLVRYLIRTQYRSSFYKFASHLREGRPVTEALYRAYGAPYTRLRALEIAWRHEISRGSMERLPSGN
ncbi:MAG: basic secretory protein-like protein [Elusimicrobiota bacterium]